MSRMDRLKEYAKPLRPENWQGASRDMDCIDRWSDRATDESHIAPRASSGPMDLPSTTSRQMGLRSTKSAPRTSAEIDARMAGKDDQNFVGSSAYMRGIRRDG